MKMRISIALCLIASVALGPAAGSAQQVALPVLGFVPDGANLRPLIGITGSASVGEAIHLGFDVAKATAPPNQDYILATDGEGKLPVWIHVRGGAPVVRPLIFSDCEWQDRKRSLCGAETPATINRVALSPTGSAAALLDEAAGRIYVFTNLAHAPVRAGRFEVGGLGSITSVAISDDAQTAAVGVSDGRLYLLNLNGAVRPVAVMQRPSAIQFFRNSTRAIVADDAANIIYSLQGAQVFPIATSVDGVASPAGIALSNDGARVFVANAESGMVITIGLNGAVTPPVHCDCRLTGLHPTNADSVFRLTDFSGGPVLLFDGASTPPRVTFVPVSPQ